jgi:hypothetical protein
MPAYLQSPNNEFIKSFLYEWNRSDNFQPAQLRPLSPNDEKFKPHYLKPFHADTIVDARLAEILPSRDTTVHEYDWFAFSHKHYFLDDMIAGTGTFCYPLLINAILTVGYMSLSNLSFRELFLLYLFSSSTYRIFYLS